MSKVLQYDINDADNDTKAIVIPWVFKSFFYPGW